MLIEIQGVSGDLKSQSIQLTNGMTALVDDDQFDLLMQYRWSAVSFRGGKYWYAGFMPWNGGGKRRTIFMHRMIANPPAGLVVDHINGNTLDNRVANLRVCTRGQNAINRKKSTTPTSSVYKGVSWSKNAWQAAVCVGQKHQYLGRFKSERDAAIAYDVAAAKVFGEFANLNFPVAPLISPPSIQIMSRR